jgi:hypothetical protein
MRSLLLVSSLVLATFGAGSAFAQSANAKAAVNTGAQARVAATPAQAVSTKEAVQVVNDFMGALASGQLEAARKFMTVDAVGDGQWQRPRPTRCLYRWSGEGRFRRPARRAARTPVPPGKGRRRRCLGPERKARERDRRHRGPSEVVIETMLLGKTPAGWKITHIHWSGRHAG